MNTIELIMVTGVNNNKFYRMTELGDGTFRVEYGRIGLTSTTEVYPISRWTSKYNEKIKKGYRDVTDLKVQKESGKISFESIEVEEFYTNFQKYVKNSVGRNYQIVSNSVTPQMISEVQGHINELLSCKEDFEKFNKNLISIFTILPRKMDNVKNYLVGPNSNIDLKIQMEQDILDSLSSQVLTNTFDADMSLKDILGCSLEISTEDHSWLSPLILKTNSSKYRPYKIFKVITDSQYFNNWLSAQDNKHTEYLIHGTRNANVFSILKSGLIIRPTNAILSGSVYGDGVYHSAHVDKSLNYTGSDLDKIFFIQNVHMGTPFIYNGWYREGKSISKSQMNYKYLKSQGYDSLYVKPGDGLRNSEYIVYNKEQTRTDYILWMK